LGSGGGTAESRPEPSFYLELHPGELNFKQLLPWYAVLELEPKLGTRGAVVVPAAKSVPW